MQVSNNIPQGSILQKFSFCLNLPFLHPIKHSYIPFTLNLLHGDFTSSTLCLSLRSKFHMNRQEEYLWSEESHSVMELDLHKSNVAVIKDLLYAFIGNNKIRLCDS